MKQNTEYQTLFELLRQRNLSKMSVRPRKLGLSDTVHPEVAAELLRQANRSWEQPEIPAD